MYNGKGMRRVANFSLNPRRRDSQIFDRRIYENLTEYDFEGYKFPGPKNFETVLRGHYGNWHEQVIGGNAHGGIVIDTDKPYTEYLKKWCLTRLRQRPPREWHGLRSSRP